jgi:tetratricopeptide (TPR) repeat protein
METRPAQSRLLLRLAQTIAESKIPISPSRHRHDPQRTKDEAVVPEAGWQRLNSLSADFEAELAYADSCLDDDPSPSEMETLLATSSELRRAAILQRFVNRAYFLRLQDPRKGLKISENLLAWTENPTTLIAVVRCRALMERGNFLRILGDREGAFRALADASRELETHGITDPLERARHEELLGTLKAYCGHVEAARQLLRRAFCKVRRWGDNYTIQRVLISAGLVEINSDNYEEAEILLKEAMATPEPDRLLGLCAATNRVLGYLANGKPRLAYQSICGLRARLGHSWLQHLPPIIQMRQVWLEGQVRNGLGMEEEAIGLLKKARESHIRADCGFEVCYISVDLALTYATQRRFVEVQRELEFALPFCSEEQAIDRLGREAVQLLLCTLRRQGRLDVELVRDVATRLYRILRTPLRIFPQSPLAELRN